MLIAILIIVVACLLVAVCALYFTYLTYSKIPVVKPPVVAVLRTDLLRVLKQHPVHGWQEHSWVQRGSDAHQTALARPGYAIEQDGRTVFGVQD